MQHSYEVVLDCTDKHSKTGDSHDGSPLSPLLGDYYDFDDGDKGA